jgi:hypothetical protein
MITYLDIENAVLDILHLHDDFNEFNCQRGGLDGIKKGWDRLVRVMYARVSRRDLTLALMEHTWTIKVDIYVPYRGRIQDMEDSLAIERQKVIDLLARYPTLNNLEGIYRAEVLTGDAPEPLGGKKTAYRGQRLWLEIKQAVQPSRGVVK